MNSEKDKQKKEEDNIEALKKRLEECEKQKEEYLQGWQKERADFINFKNQEIKRIKDYEDAVKKDIAVKIINILDTINLSEEYFKDIKNKKMLEGFWGIKKQIENLLNELEVKEMDIQSGDEFLYEKHEALDKEISEKYKKEVVIEVFQKGYEMKGKVIRPARVKVGIPKT